NKRRWIDSSVMTGALLLYATPLFWLSLMGILLFSVVLGWLPAFGMETVGASLTGWARVADIAQHLILPTVTLGCFFMAVYVRLTRASMLEVIGMDFVKTARAKGVSPSRVIRVHVLRNALLPVITFAGIQLGQMAGGAVLTETVFAWPGIGRLMFDALLQRDYQLLLGIFLVTSIMVVVFNLLTDVLYRLIDPRIAAGAQQGAAA
ncbi:MAG: ABC transporter permease, partial [Achromobacter piechaudii]